MQIDIQSHGFTATGALREHVTRRLQLALGCCADRVARATVRLVGHQWPARRRGQTAADPGAPDDPGRCGDRRHGNADLYVAIDRAAERVGRTTVRHLARQRRPLA